MAWNITEFFTTVIPRRLSRTARSVTRTWQKFRGTNAITMPHYRDHLIDIYAVKGNSDSRQLLKHLFKHDSDLSATVDSYLTLADTDASIIAYNADGSINEKATKEVQALMKSMTYPRSYTKGYQHRQSARTLYQEMRYMALLRGSIGLEAILDRRFLPERFQQVDMATIEWVEESPGVYKPVQDAANTDTKISLDIPTFFTAFHRRDPTEIYSQSDFVAAINLIAARQQVINDLYRIMRVTGFPRISIKVLEEVLSKNVPAQLKTDPEQAHEWKRSRMREIAKDFASLSADQAFIHPDSVEVSTINKDKPGASLQIKEVIDTLNSQCQAAMKTMATIIGRGTQGVNTASVEARIAAMNADQLNVPIAEVLERALTFLMNLHGTAGYVEVKFKPAELRPYMELEPQRTMQSSRLRTDLSLGLISDVEYHLQVHGRLPDENMPRLSGTNFEAPTVGVDEERISPNSDPLGRGLAPEGSESARSN